MCAKNFEKDLILNLGKKNFGILVSFFPKSLEYLGQLVNLSKSFCAQDTKYQSFVITKGGEIKRSGYYVVSPDQEVLPASIFLS